MAGLEDTVMQEHIDNEAHNCGGDEEFSLNKETSQSIITQEPFIKPYDSISQVGQKRLRLQIEPSIEDHMPSENPKRPKTQAESIFDSSTSQAIVVAYTDLSVIEQLRQLETSAENSFVGAQTI